MVFIASRWAKNRRYGPYYYLGWYEGGKIKWRYLGKLEGRSPENIEMLEQVRVNLQKKAERIDEIIDRLRGRQNERMVNIYA